MRLSLACLALVATWRETPPAAAFVLGNGPARTQCYAAFDGVTPNRGTRRVDCTDGDSSCDADGFADGTCTFTLRVCADVPGVRRCHPRSVNHISIHRLNGNGTVAVPPPPLPATSATCGAFGRVTVPAGPPFPGGPRPGHLTLGLRASAAGHRRRTHARLGLGCNPSPDPCPDPSCGPNMLYLRVSETGSDLDLGWMGVAHNIPIPGGWSLGFSVYGCDGHTNPVCEVEGPGLIGPRNPTLTVPLPVVVGGVPGCIVTTLATHGIAGTANVQTGEFDAVVDVLADVYLTSTDHVCPRCVGQAPAIDGMAAHTGMCDSGAWQGSFCGVDAREVVWGATGDPTYLLSSACPPAMSTLAGTIPLTIHLTTGVSTLTGPSPCALPGQPPLPDDACRMGVCTEGICTDCVALTPDGACVASRGGIQQACCSTDPTRPCFPTAPGSIGKIERIGHASPPIPAWPLAAYPKTATGRLVATFCVPSAPSSSLIAMSSDGPGALILPITEEWMQYVPG